MAKPRRDPTEMIGVSAVASIIHSEFEWIFREQHHTDMGIDAEIEIDEDGSPSGILIGVQIKSTRRSLESEKGHLIYYFKDAHYDYWTNHSLPVILIVHLVKNKNTYWQFLNKTTLKRTEKNWKIEIPLSQELNRSAIEPIKNYLKGLNKPTTKILQATSELDNFSPNWRVGHHTTDDAVFFYPQPKHDSADKDEPLTLKLSFQEGLVVDGINIQDIVSNPSLITKPMVFSKSMIKGIEVSDFLKNAMGFGENSEWIQIVPLKRVIKLLVKFVDYQANEYIFDNIVVDVERNSVGKIILSNEKQDVPYHLTLTSFDQNKQINISISIESSGFSVNEILKGFKFLQATSKGGILTIVDKVNNVTLLRRDFSPKPKNDYGDEFIEVLELLYIIENKLGLNFLLPDRDMTNEEIFKIKTIGYLIKGDSMMLGKDFQWWNIELDSKKTIDFIEQIEKYGAISFYKVYDDWEESLFETNLNLGRVHCFCGEATINEEEKTKIATQVSNKEEKIKITLQPFNNSLVFHFFENFMENGKELSEEKIRKLWETSPVSIKRLD